VHAPFRLTIAVSDEDVKAAATYVYSQAVAHPSGSDGADFELKFDDALSKLLRELFKQLNNYKGKSKDQLATDRRELADQVVFGVMQLGHFGELAFRMEGIGDCALQVFVAITCAAYSLPPIVHDVPSVHVSLTSGHHSYWLRFSYPPARTARFLLQVPPRGVVAGRSGCSCAAALYLKNPMEVCVRHVRALHNLAVNRVQILPAQTAYTNIGGICISW
jgi:hypothetical protein